ncbi:sulfur oxidation c-type cytochrome SoxX [Nitratifractor sp.]
MQRMKLFLAASAMAGLLSVGASAGNADLVKQGEKIFNTKKIGNCLACHAVNGKNINNPGTLGPKLQGLSAWPAEALYAKVYNPYTTNPISAMPPFGLNGVLDDHQIKAVVAYLKTVK